MSEPLEAAREPRQERYDALYLSPHLDDVVLSCGGQVHQRCARGERVLVLTIFGGEPPAGPLSELAAQILEQMGLERRDALAIRRAEDAAACEILGAEAVHWPFSEATFRRADGEAIYGDVRALFARPAPADAPLVDELAQALARLPPADMVVAPLAVGSHVDHHVVRQAAEAAFADRLAYYEDFPYVAKLFALGKALGKRKAWRRVTVPTSGVDLEARQRAIGAYGSQVPALFRSVERMRRAVRRAARRAGGERLWYRRLGR